MKHYSILLLLMLKLMGTRAQNVGIGTNAPVAPLTVVPNNAGKGIIQKSSGVEVGFYTNNESAYIQTWSNHSLFFATNNGNASMALSPSGFLGIGSISPTATLDVNGSVRIRGGSPTPGAVLTSVDENGNAVWKNEKVAFRGASVHGSFQSVPHNTFRKVHFSSESYDYSNGFQATTSSSPSVSMSSFVVPVSGVYHLEVAIDLFLASTFDDFIFTEIAIRVNRSGNIFNALYRSSNCCNDLGFSVKPAAS
nr:hypothetical protein [Chitinophagaceae bacterium]